jgi:hypothetical protein
MLSKAFLLSLFALVAAIAPTRSWADACILPDRESVQILSTEIQRNELYAEQLQHVQDEMNKQIFWPGMAIDGQIFPMFVSFGGQLLAGYTFLVQEFQTITAKGLIRFEIIMTGVDVYTVRMAIRSGHEMDELQAWADAEGAKVDALKKKINFQKAQVRPCLLKFPD